MPKGAGAALLETLVELINFDPWPVEAPGYPDASVSGH